MEYLIAVIAGYLLGSINPAYICGRLKGFDIRERGTHSAGASNAKITMGWPYFVIAVVYDVSKSVIAYFVTVSLFPGCKTAGIIAGCCAVIGHCFPFYLGFRGGKGFAAYIGLTLVIAPKRAIILIACGVAVSFVFSYIVIATATQVIGFPIYLYSSGAFPTEVIIAVTLTSLVIIFQHRANVVKLLSKQEIGINGKLIGFNILNKKENEKTDAE